MIAIQRGATEVIYLTAINEKNEVAKDEISGMLVDVLIVQKDDNTKYIHKSGVVNSENGVISVELTAWDTASISGYANLEVRDTSNGVIIATKVNAFDFRYNEIHKHPYISGNVSGELFHIFAHNANGTPAAGYITVGNYIDTFVLDGGYVCLGSEYMLYEGDVVKFITKDSLVVVESYVLTSNDISSRRAEITLQTSYMNTEEITQEETTEEITQEETTEEITQEETTEEIVEQSVDTNDLETVMNDYEQE